VKEELDKRLCWCDTAKAVSFSVLGTIKKITSPSASLFSIILRQQNAIIGSL